MTAAAVEVPVIKSQHAVKRHIPAVIAPVEPLPLAALWHRDPACEVDHKDVGWTAVSGRCATPVIVDIRHYGGIARLGGWLGDPRPCKVNAWVDRHRHALLRQILSAHDGQKDKRAEDDP